MSGQLTRSDFEALLWAYLSRQLRDPDDGLAAALTINHDTWTALTDAELAEFHTAVDNVKAETGRRVWQKEGDPR